MKFRGSFAAIFLAIVLLFLSLVSHAGDGFVKGTVEFMRLHDGATVPAWTPPRFWFALTGVMTAGACPANWNGRMVFVGDSKEAYLTILSAFMTGKEVAVYYDDTVTVNSHCRAVYITLGNPPPLF